MSGQVGEREGRSLKKDSEDEPSSSELGGEEEEEEEAFELSQLSVSALPAPLHIVRVEVLTLRYFV